MFVSVPNAPCGVERIVFEIIQFHNVSCVPNAPCGVERDSTLQTGQIYFGFLMHRVELKGNCILVYSKQYLEFLMHRVELKAVQVFSRFAFSLKVPNAPCGVESWRRFGYPKSKPYTFLMHRVELKAFSAPSLPCSSLVPNAPCGVERKVGN